MAVPWQLPRRDVSPSPSVTGLGCLGQGCSFPVQGRMSGVMSPTTNSAKRTEARCENVYTYISMGEVDMNGEYVHDEDECGV